MVFLMKGKQNSRGSTFLDTTKKETPLSKTLVTHDGTFHANDVLSYVILRLAGVAGGRLIRTRRQKLIDQGDIVFDVGGKYNPSTGRYDHHQSGGAGTRRNGVPYASAGLIWKDFGKHVCRRCFGKCDVDFTALVRAVDRSVVQGIDATDVAVVKGAFRLLETDQEIRVRSLSDIVLALNPVEIIDGPPSVSNSYEAFLRAADMTELIFKNLIRAEIALLVTAEHIVQCETGGPILVLEKTCPWEEAVVAELPEVLFVVYPTSTGQWNCEAVPKVLDEFPVRLDLPKEWAGLKNEIFQGFTGVKDAIFCNNTRHMCGARSREGALALAELALKAR